MTSNELKVLYINLTIFGVLEQFQCILNDQAGGWQPSNERDLVFFILSYQRRLKSELTYCT